MFSFLWNTEGNHYLASLLPTWSRFKKCDKLHLNQIESINQGTTYINFITWETSKFISECCEIENADGDIGWRTPSGYWRSRLLVYWGVVLFSVLISSLSVEAQFTLNANISFIEKSCIVICVNVSV